MNSTVNTKLVVTYDACVEVDERELNEAATYTIIVMMSGRTPHKHHLTVSATVNDRAGRYTIHDIAISDNANLTIVLRDEGSTREDARLIYGEDNPNRFLVVEESDNGYRPRQMVYVTRHDAALSA